MRKNVGEMETQDVYDLVGVGFGPAGIALAVAMEDADETRPLDEHWRSLFIERAADSLWQPNMLLSGCDIQHHYLRDFATPRNPRSRFTFPCYLQQKGRLFSFGHLGGNPGRIEWADYVEWVSRQVSHRALYGHQVASIEPVFSDSGREVELVRVQAQSTGNGSMRSCYARNVVLCTGRKPNVPSAFVPYLGPRVFHSNYYLRQIERLTPGEYRTVVVIGSGQNAIEILLDLADRFPNANIVSINRNNGFRLYDLGHFSNECYFPEEVDYFYGLEKEARTRLFNEMKYTNYSSVDADVSRALYWRVYEDRVRGHQRIHVVKRSAVEEVLMEDERLHLGVRDLYCGNRHTVSADLVVLCTGFVEEQVPSLLEPIRPFLRLDADGDLEVGRDYDVATVEGFRVGIFLNGLTEHTHGISDAASFSMMAIKAQRTLDQLDARRAESVMEINLNLAGAD
jgi:L-ornithine N5-oxygenase